MCLDFFSWATHDKAIIDQLLFFYFFTKLFIGAGMFFYLFDKDFDFDFLDSSTL
jgi:hypothetical protein